METERVVLGLRWMRKIVLKAAGNLEEVADLYALHESARSHRDTYGRGDAVCLKKVKVSRTSAPADTTEHHHN